MIYYDQIDLNIKSLVYHLNAHGFVTIGSCEGSENHSAVLPTVQIRADGDLDDLRKQLIAWLIENKFLHFTARTVSMHQRSTIPEPYSYIEIEFWSLEDLKFLEAFKPLYDR